MTTCHVTDCPGAHRTTIAADKHGKKKRVPFLCGYVAAGTPCDHPCYREAWGVCQWPRRKR